MVNGIFAAWLGFVDRSSIFGIRWPIAETLGQRLTVNGQRSTIYGQRSSVIRQLALKENQLLALTKALYL
jgi:hypothetical protein